MKYTEQTRKVFVANDGTVFENESHCLDYCKEQEWKEGVLNLAIKIEDHFIDFLETLDDEDCKEEYSTERSITEGYGRGFVDFLAEKMYQEEKNV